MPGLFRRYPFLVATTAASGGVLLGAYMAFQIFAAPVAQRGPLTPTQPVARTNATATDTRAPAIASETTGSAPANDELAAGDRCKGQTWPNLTRDCMEQKQSRKSTRTVSTTPIEKPVPQAPPIASAPSNEAAVTSAPAAAATAAPAATAVASPASPTAQQVAAPNNPPTVADAKSDAKPEAKPDTKSDTKSAKDRAKSEKRKIKEAKRKAKKPNREDESDDRALAYAPTNDRDNAWGDRVSREDRADRRATRGDDRADRSRRERVMVRGEDDDDGDRVSERGGRRVIVIRRDRDGGDRDGGFGGGIFGGLFGN